MIDIFLSINASSLGAVRRLHVYHVTPEQLCGVCRVLDLSVWVQSEDGWRLVERHVVLDVLKVLLNSLVLWNHVIKVLLLREEELLVLVENEVSKVLFQISRQHSSVEVIRNSATVHGFSDQIAQSVPW